MDLIKEKKMLFSALTGLLGVVIIVLLYVMFWGVLEPQKQYPTRNISISATGKAVAKPDVAIVSFSVVTEGKDTKTISDQNNEKVSKAITFLKGQGIDEKDIKTTEYNLSPVYSQQAISSVSSRTTGAEIAIPVSAPAVFVPSIAKYSLTQTVQVKIRDFKKTSEIVDALTPMGINRINRISFSVDDPETYRAQARAEAIEKAKAKAQVMAQQLGISLGDLVNISEYADGGGVQPMVSDMSGYSMKALSSIAPTIEAGSQDITVNASLTYEIK